jgi:hypothetical protein
MVGYCASRRTVIDPLQTIPSETQMASLKQQCAVGCLRSLDDRSDVKRLYGPGIHQFGTSEAISAI